MEIDRGRLKMILRYIIIIVIILLMIKVGPSIIENRMLFYPNKNIEFKPQDYNLINEDVFFKSLDGTNLHGWFFPYTKSKDYILLCHGNAGNISHRLEYIKLLHEIVKCNVFIFDYRGYGLSKGKPSEQGVSADAIAAFDYLIKKKKIKADSIILLGRSLGGAVAIELALHRSCKALILENTFTNLSDMAKFIFPFIPGVHLLASDNFNNLIKIKNLHNPILFIHGKADHTVPFKHSQILFEKANEPKELYEIREAGHNDTYLIGGDEYFYKIKSIINKPSPVSL